MLHSRRFGVRVRLGTVALAAVLNLVAAAEVAARDFYVSPTGAASHDGSLARPLDLATAIASTTPARPGDTIWMRGGVYRGAFTSALTGTAAAPITLRQYPGERATIDNAATPSADAFVVNGSYAVYWDFEITNTFPDRRGTPRGAGLTVYGAYTKFINLVIHDAGVGVGFWTPAINAELYGLIIYNNGIDTDRGHGHSVYAQNDTGTKRIVDNIMLNSYSFGIHAYTQGGRVNNFVMDGNILFNHGALSAVSGPKSNLLLGGGQVAYDSTIRSNYTYYPAGSSGRGADIGYGTPCNRATVENNYWVGGTAINLACDSSGFSNNTLYGGVSSTVQGLYPNNTYLTTRPSGTWTFVRPNQYETGRANIAIYNWARQSAVSVNLSGVGLAVGEPFEIRDAQNFWGPPVVTGTYSLTPVVIPMTGLAVAPVIGNAPLQPQHTGPDFGAFVVLRRGTGTPQTLTADVTATPATITAGQSATLTWSTSNATAISIAPHPGSVAANGQATVSPATTTTYTLTATSASGATTTRTATVGVSSPPPPSSVTATAAFVKTDATTRGSWKGVYGGEGHALATLPPSYPAYAQVTMSGQGSWSWTASTTDARALQKPGAGTDRVAACWFGGVFTIDVNLTDGAEHQIALYGLDWDTNSRGATIEVLDAATSTVLDRQTMAGFSGGQVLGLEGERPSRLPHPPYRRRQCRSQRSPLRSRCWINTHATAADAERTAVGEFDQPRCRNFRGGAGHHHRGSERDGW